ncbi:MAG: phosphate acetyltransferase [Gammaproteobacteria bacterium SG8_11]|nr:MAG: phosphate acetyltransferase [Gammaproteobacteria bacterium SG8_11]
MAQNIYVAGAEAKNGKSVIALGLMELLSTRTNRLGFFRPVIRSKDVTDSMIELMATRYALSVPYDAMYGCSYEQARDYLSQDRYDELLKVILEKYKSLQTQCDHIVCLGTDYSGVTAALEFDFNADVANNLGCYVMPVVNGYRRNAEQIINAATVFIHLLEERGCDIMATIVNRVEPKNADKVTQELNRSLELTSPLYVLAENASLSKPTMWDIAQALDAVCLYGDPETLNREVYNYKVAAMLLPEFLNYVEANSLIITPWDRSDIILGSLMSYPSRAYPQIAGLLLSGDSQPAKEVMQLIDGLGTVPVAVLSVPTDTFTTAMNVSSVTATLSVDNERKIAAALGAIETNIDTDQLLQRITTSRSTRVTPLMFEYELIRRARTQRQHIVLPEGNEPRILQASEILTLRDVAKITLLGDPEQIRTKIDELGLHLDEVDIIDPLQSNLRQRFADTYYELRRHKGISREMAYDVVADVSYFGTMMVYHDLADGMVSGSVNTTQHTIRPSFETIKTKPDAKIVSSVFFMCLEDRVLVFGDCAVNPNPNAEQLADIAINSALTAQKFGVEPRIAMLSYSTGESGKGEAVDKVRQATNLVKQLRPDLKIAGPIQYDAAVDISVAKTKLPGNEVGGNATVFIFPDLNTGNNTYKAVQRSANALAIGPVLQGLNKPVNDLSRGCTIPDIVNTVAITAIQAQADLLY